MNTSWYEYIERAFRTVYYGGAYEQPLEAFVQRWGELTEEAFIQILSTGTSEERVLALFTLGYSDTPHVKEALLPFLISADPQERWASALALGERREEQVLPVLIALLDEFLPPRSHPLEKEGGLYHSWRLKVVSSLGEWERGELAPVLRSALEKSWKIEQVEQIAHKQVWHSYQDELIYALGRLGAFGVCTGFAVPAPRLRLWMVGLACGSLQARTRYGDLLTQIQINSDLQKEVSQVLEQRFGLPAEERHKCLDHYADEYFARMEWK